MSATNGTRPPKPAPPPLPPDADEIPELEDLIRKRRWLLWDWTWKPDLLKYDKPPRQANGEPASTTDPRTWTTYAQALATARARRWGIGYVLSRATGDDKPDSWPAEVDPADWPPDTIVGWDFDHVRDPATGEIDPTALRRIRHLDSYTEISPSGTGVRVFVHADLPVRGRKLGPVECYQTSRYMTVTGQRLELPQ